MAAASDRGQRRTRNEDAVVGVSLPGGHTVLAVADGVGGNRAGDVASASAAEALVIALAQDHDSDGATALLRAFQSVNQALCQQSAGDARLEGMATTLVAALVSGDEAWLANVGDSRAYLVEDGRLEQLTEDHSVVAERVRAGALTEDAARSSGARHVITRSLGIEPSVDVDVYGPVVLAQDARLLLCSDGLHDVVSSSDIADIAAHRPPAEAARRLVEVANEHGGPDNISAVIYAHDPHA
jgi:protein phosphatase